ncbi:hypothetical protein S1OALGB6SA_2166 [Olavius algarvensis spirochete endosymbiont]|uniref:LysM peptidoglycan-binding domain-containing protein n=1 Tax=Olavius algarvensis spirochete endosymbiont TaxID=260710 RepID=UPI000F1B9187|nr:hypothetical protein [Olavius algarvensis spirochete endosymbiont]VDB01068.1 hypothetical protein S1OALGB6SA_2166 [Olavius algarvensis spirochete endosymbiont]
MFRKLLFFVVLISAAVFAWSQSLQDNEFYTKMVELRDMSREAFEEGDYAEAKRLALESQSYSERSEAWIEERLAAFRASAGLNQLKNLLDQVASWGAETKHPKVFAEGTDYYNKAYAEFHNDENYVQSFKTSRSGMEVLTKIVAITDVETPAYYVVRLLPGNTDCLWNIAGYDFIYNDPSKWRAIYDANESAMPEADNPHLILPGMILEIPSVSGETRSGTWQDGIVK